MGRKISIKSNEQTQISHFWLCENTYLGILAGLEIRLMGTVAWTEVDNNRQKSKYRLDSRYRSV